MHTTDRYDREDARSTFEAIARDTLANGGGTYRRETGAKVTLTTGYTVGIATVAAFGADRCSDVHVIAGALAREWPTTAPATAQYVGTWIDADASLLFIDHVVVISDLSIALSLARRCEQVAIYDNARGTCIDVDDDDDDDAYRDAQWRHIGYAYGFVRGTAAYLTPGANVSEWPFEPFKTVAVLDAYNDGYADGYDNARDAFAECDNY